MKRLLMLVLMVVAVMGLSACTYEAKYTIHKDGSVDVDTMTWYDIYDMKEMLKISDKYISASGTEMTPEARERLEAIMNIDTMEELIAYIKENDETNEVLKNTEIKTINGITLLGDKESMEHETYGPEYLKEMNEAGYNIKPDTFEFDTEEIVKMYSGYLSSADSEEKEQMEAFLKNSYFLLTVEMPEKILFTNGELSEDGKSVFFNISLGGKNQKYYAYTTSSKSIIDMGIDNGAYTKKNTITVSTPDKITSLTVDGKSVSGNKISLDKDGKYEVSVKTSTSEKTVKFVKDSTKPEVKGVENGKTYKGTVTISFSDKTSGIKSAKLGKKKIKNGAKVSKAGKYTLKVTDKAGNKTTVKFSVTK